MKRLIYLLVTLALIVFHPLATGQENNVEVKHLFVPSVNRNLGASVSALNIERGSDYPSIVRLKGNVEIKIPVCLRTAAESPMICNGSMIVTADEAEMHEDNGRIEAHGKVTVTPTRF